jgi:transposase
MEGVSKTKIAKIMGRSRQTIYAAIKQKPDPVYVYKAYLKRKL